MALSNGGAIEERSYRAIEGIGSIKIRQMTSAFENRFLGSRNDGCKIVGGSEVPLVKRATENQGGYTN